MKRSWSTPFLPLTLLAALAVAACGGESNFLPVGTTLHQIEGYEPTERLAFWSDVLEEWQVLSTLHVTTS